MGYSSHTHEEGYGKAKKGQGRLRIFTSHILALLIIIPVFVFALPSFADYGDTFSQLGELEVNHLLLLCVLSAATFLLSIFMFQLSLPGMRFRQALELGLSQNLVANTLPAGGPVSLGFTYAIIRSYGFTGADLTLMLGVSGIWNVFSKLSLPIFSVILFALSQDASAELVSLAVLGGLALAGSIVVLTLIFWKPWFARWVGDLAGKGASWLLKPIGKPPVTTWGDALVQFRDQAIGVARSRWIPLTVTATIFQFTTFGVFLASVRFVGISNVQVPFAEVLMVFAFARFVSAVPLTPGALGISEISYTAMLITAGAAHPEAVASVLLFRGLTYLLPLPFGVISSISWITRNRRNALKEGGPLQAEEEAALTLQRQDA